MADFHTMPYSGQQMETFSVNGVRLSYSDYVIVPCFNNTRLRPLPLQRNVPALAFPQSTLGLLGMPPNRSRIRRGKLCEAGYPARILRSTRNSPLVAGTLDGPLRPFFRLSTPKNFSIPATRFRRNHNSSNRGKTDRCIQ